MKYCRFCGTQFPDEAAFCPQCGRRVEVSASERMPHQEYRQDRKGPKVQIEKKQPEKSGRGLKKALCGILAFVLLIELAFFHPGFLREKGPGEEITPTAPVIPPDGNGNPPGNDVGLTDFEKETARYLGITEEALKTARKEPLEVTPENSPGNPFFIDVSFSEAEYADAPTLTADVSREAPEADFPEFGIHVDLKSWNLLHDTDKLIIKKLPAKKDPVTGCELYTYSYALASGQDHFSTNVEVTVPIQGDPRIFDGVLYRNEDTGKWEEVYYKLTPDGRSYIARTDHFSDNAQRSDQAALEKMQQQGRSIDELYKENGKSIFKILPYEDAAKYNGTQTWLFGVGLTSLPDFDKFSRLDSENANHTLQTILDESGGVPVEASFTEACSTFGKPTDFEGAVLSTLDTLGLKKGAAFCSNLGMGLTSFGAVLLWARIANQYQRGVDPQKIKESNRWNYAATMAGLAAASVSQAASVAQASGLVIAGHAAAPLLLAVSPYISAVCISIYVASVTDSLLDAWMERKRKEKERNTFSTIEEAAYFYFLTEYSMEKKENCLMPSSEAFKYIVATDPTSYDDTHEYQSVMVDLYGKNWAYALRYLVEKYHMDPVKMEKQYRHLCNHFIDAFWSENISDSVRNDCWCRALEKILDSGYFGYYYSTISNPSEDTLRELGITREEHDRRAKLQAKLNKAGSTDKLFEGLGFDKSEYVRFNQLDSNQVMAYKKRAMNTLLESINPLFYEIYQAEYEKGILEARNKLLFEVLPFLNTRITFYAKDLSLNKDQATHLDSPYYQFKEDGVGKKGDNVFEFISDHQPIFSPANDGAGYYCNWGLYLSASEYHPVLLETNVYHYLRFGCPARVKVTETPSPFGTTLPEIEGRVNWDGVKLTIDENSLWNAVPENKSGKYSPVFPIKDMKVPVEYESGEEPDLEKFMGYWEQIGGTGNIISIDRGGNKDQLAYGERNIKQNGNSQSSTGKQAEVFEMGFAADSWVYDRKTRVLTLTSSAFLGGMIECRLIDENYIEIKNGQGNVNHYIRTDTGYVVKGMTETYKGAGPGLTIPSGRSTMGGIKMKKD